MSKVRRLLSVLIAVLMVLTLPVTTGIARTIAEGTTEPGESGNPSEGVSLEMEDLDPATLHVHKLGEGDEPEAEQEPSGEEPDPLNDPSRDPEEIVRVSIFLDGKSTIDQGFPSRGISENTRAIEYRKNLKKQQNVVQTKIESAIGHKLTVKWNLTLLVNAISVEIPYKDAKTISSIPGVKSVELEMRYEVPRDVEGDQPNTANTSSEMIGASAAWDAGFTGAGSRIAIIDTGIDTSHQSFAAEPFTYAVGLAGATSELMTQAQVTALRSQLNSGSANYVSAKIPYAYNYIDSSTTISHTDCKSNHGSHVAGIAAANRFIGSAHNDAITTVHAVGMAPDAQLIVMYAAWLWRKRDGATGPVQNYDATTMPRMLRLMLNNRVFKEKAVVADG